MNKCIYAPWTALFSKRLLLVCLIIAFAGCVPSHVLTKKTFERPSGSLSVLLMPLDVELSALTAGGIKEVRADWTATAKQLISESLEQELGNHNMKLIEYVEPESAEALQIHNQLIKLHGVVGNTIFLYSVLPKAVPPTIKGEFEWALGKETSSLRVASEADYGLFVFVRDSYATAGRKAMIVTAALLGVNIRGGVQIGFATLVDLHNGDVIWFNYLANTTGDLRTEEPTDKAVEQLLEKIPL